MKGLGGRIKSWPVWTFLERVWEWQFVRLIRSAWSVVRPMFIPLIGIAFIGLLNGSTEAFIVGTLLALAAGVLLVLPGVRPNLRALLNALGIGAALAVLIGATGAVLVWRQKSGDDFVDTWDAFSRILVIVGFVLWGLVFVFRLGTFARNPARKFFAVILLALYGRYFFSLFVADDRLPTTVDHVVWGGLLVTTLLLVFVMERTYGGEPGPRGKFTQLLHTSGLSAAILAALSFVGAGLTGLYADPQTERVTIRGLNERKAGDVPPPAVANWFDDPTRLASEFAPLLGLTDSQRWEPIDVETYLADAELFARRKQPKQGRKLPPRFVTDELDEPEDLPDTCPKDLKGRCYELTVNCHVEDSDTSDCERGDSPQTEGRATRGTAYTRVIYADRLKNRRGTTAAATEKARRDRVFGRTGTQTYGPYQGDLAAIVQYWLFYYYDDWKASTLFGELRQAHEADWEVVTVGLSRTKPLFVGLSAHCGGTWLPWEDVTVADGAHPIVGVAEGSQAIYHDPKENIPPPNWDKCAKLEVDLADPSLGYRIRDRTGIHTLLQPAHLTPVDDDSAIMRFPGIWGRFSTAHFYTALGRQYELQTEGDGPATPSRQSLWSNTVLETFCDNAFRQVGGGPKLPKRCPPKKKPG